MRNASPLAFIPATAPIYARRQRRAENQESVHYLAQPGASSARLPARMLFATDTAPDLGGGDRMSDAYLDVATSNRPVSRSEVVPPPSASQPQARDLGLRTHTEGDVTLPFAGQPGHGRAASLRRQPVRIVDGRIEGGYSNAFELICPACGDNPDLDYSQVSPRLQWLRGPRTLQVALAAYEKHLGLRPRPDEASRGNSGAGAAKTGMTQAFTEETLRGYRHEALLYSGMSEFLTGTMSFIRRAVNAGDPILVVVSSSKFACWNELGAEAGQVSFADMAEVGGNPGRITLHGGPSCRPTPEPCSCTGSRTGTSRRSRPSSPMPARRSSAERRLRRFHTLLAAVPWTDPAGAACSTPPTEARPGPICPSSWWNGERHAAASR